MKDRRSRGERHLRLPHFLLHSAAWKDLDPVARCLFIEVAERYNGTNNGHIGLGVREAGKALHCKPATAGAAFKRLIDHGFLRIGTVSAFNVTRRATEWIVTMFPRHDKSGKETGLQTMDFMRWSAIAEKQNPVPFKATHSADRGYSKTADAINEPLTVPPNGTYETIGGPNK